MLGIYHLLQVSQHNERMFAYRHISYFTTVVLQLSFVSVHDLLGGNRRFCSDLASSHLNGVYSMSETKTLTIQDCRTPKLLVSMINSVFCTLLDEFGTPDCMLLSTKRIDK